VNSNKQNFISPASVGVAGVSRKNPSANSGYSKAANNSAVNENGAGQIFD